MRRYHKRLVLSSAILLVSLATAVILFFCAYRFAGPMIRVVTDAGANTDYAVLFGSATITLTVITILLAVLSFFGWINIAEKVRYEAGRFLDTTARRDLAVVRASDAAIYSALVEYLRMGHDRKEHDESFFTDYAITYSRMSLEMLGDGAARGEANDLEWKVRNNLAYMLAVRGHDKDAEEAMLLLNEIKKLINHRSEPVEIQLTTACVIARYARQTESNPLKFLNSAKINTEHLIKHGALSIYEHGEATRTLRDLESAIREEKENPARKHPNKNWRQWRKAACQLGADLGDLIRKGGSKS